VDLTLFVTYGILFAWRLNVCRQLGSPQQNELGMEVDEKLDLSGIIAPCSFLLCKSRLASMKPGAVLEVHVSDPETLKDLLTILDRSGEKIVARMQNAHRTCLWVEKGDCPPASVRTIP
jgi:TusA-related sulfurtransferase